jgi:MFS family permease
MAVGGAFHDKRTVSENAPDLPRVTWYKHAGLIKLYLLLLIVLSSSATTGFDGSLMNALQSSTQWNDYFDSPTGASLGLLNAIYPVGSMVAMPIFPFIADRFGRRWGIITGAVIMYVSVPESC